jgi:hypothetical protein
MQLTKTNTAIAQKQIDSRALFQAITEKNTSVVALLERNLKPTTAFGKPALSTFRRQNEEDLFNNLETLIIRLSLSFNVGKNIESWQVADIATDLYQKYHYFSLEEFILVLKKGRSGEFGKTYDRLDGAIIMDWFEKYDTSDERLALVHQKRIARASHDKQENKEMLLHIFQHPQMRELVKEIRKNVEFVSTHTSEEDYQTYKAQYLKTRILNQQPAINQPDNNQDLENPQSDFP